MRERRDFHCLHEPFMYHYYINQRHRDMPYFKPQADHPVRYEDVRDMIMQKALAAPVFFKDMGYYVDSEVINDKEFSESVTHCFLIRNPRATMSSYYHLDKELTKTEVGLEAQWSLYTHLVEVGSKPVVIQAESLRKDVRAAAEDWWTAIGLASIDTAFEWNDKHPDDWNQVKTWHQSAIASTSIRPWSAEDEQLETQRFEEAANEAPHLRSYLEHHEIFYQKLKNVSL